MEQNFEIEFKNLLTKDEYLNLLSKEFPDDSNQRNKKAIYQTNYYFDTSNKDLKKQHSALRIRVTDSSNEMTLKVPYQGFLMENNLHLSDNKASEIIKNKQIVLSSFNSPDNNFSFLDKEIRDSTFYLFNSFQTKRFEKPIKNHLIVLDETTFQNGVVHYELEVESTDEGEGKEFFESILNMYRVPIRKASPKIQRAENNQ